MDDQVNSLMKSDFQDISILPTSPAKPSKRRVLCISEKIELIKMLDSHPKSRGKVAAMYGIPLNTASTIYANREKLLSKCKSDFTNMNLKRLRSSSYPDIEEELLNWFIKIQSENNQNHVTCHTMRAKALQIAKNLGHNNFSASNGWIERFKCRHNLKFKRYKSKGSNVVSSNNSATTETLSGVSGEIEPFNSEESKKVWENISNPVMEMTVGQEEYENSSEMTTIQGNYEDSYSFGSESESPALENVTIKNEESHNLPSHFIPEVHFVESDMCNQSHLYRELKNKSDLPNLSIQKVDDAFKVILNYVKIHNENASEKTLDALKELKTYITREKDKKSQSKITDYFNIV